MNDLKKYLIVIKPESGVEIALFPVEKAHLIDSSFLPPRDAKRLADINHPRKRHEFLASRYSLNHLVPNYKLNYQDRRPDLESGQHVSLTHCTKYGGAM